MGRRTHLAMLVLATALLLGVLPAPPSQAATVWTSWKCAPAGCKYGQTRIKYDRQIKTWYAAEWKGGTASQTCDPSNDVKKWRLQELKATSGLTYGWGPQTYQTNCAVDDGYFGFNVNRSWSGGLDVKFTHFHDVACGGCDFTSVTWHYG